MIFRFAMLTLVELIAALVLILMVVKEKSLIAFEDKVLEAIKLKMRSKK